MSINFDNNVRGKNMRFIKFHKNSDNRKLKACIVVPIISVDHILQKLSERQCKAFSFRSSITFFAHPVYWPVCQKIFEVCSPVFDLSLPVVVTHIILFLYRFQETVQRLVKVHLL